MFIGIGLSLTGQYTRGEGAPAGPVAPTITSTGPAASYVDGATLGGTLTADEVVTWSKSGTDAGLVTLDTSTGVWSLPTLDYATKASYDFTFTATDADTLTDTQQWAFSVTEATAIPTPAITKTNDAGDPLTFSVDGIGYVVGYYWQLQLAGSSDFTVDYPTEADIRDEVRQVTMSDFTDDDADAIVEMDPFAVLTDQKAGTAYLRIRLGYDDGTTVTWGSWSNTISETVTTLTAATWSTVDKSLRLTLSGGDLTVTDDATNANTTSRVRATGARTGKRYFEVIVDAMPTTSVYAGLGDSSFDYTVNGGNDPGNSGSPGLRLSNTGGVINNGTTTGSVTAAFVAGNRMCFAFDTTANKIWVGRSASGTRTWNGNPDAGTGGFTPATMADWYAWCGMTVKTADSRILTGVFEAADMAHAPPTGFLGYNQ